MLNFNGVDFSDIVIVNDVKRPILPPQKLVALSIVGRQGSFLFYKQSEAYTIDVKITIKGKDHKDLRAKVRALAERLYTEDVAPLVFSDEPDKYIMAIISDDSELDEIYTIGQGTIKFYCPDPFWYAVNDDIFTYNSPGTYRFSRKGTADSFPKIEIKGTNTGGSITISDGNNTMTFTGELLSGETLVLDSDLITAYIIKTNGDKVPVMDKLSNLDFPVLKKGTNTLSVSVSGGAAISQVKIYCKSRWL